MIEAYPVFAENSNKPQREFVNLGRKISTPIWDKTKPTRSGKFQPKRNPEGIIQCRTDADKEACLFAHQYCKKKQTEFDNQALYPELYRQKKEADKKAEMDFIEYLQNLIKRRSVDVGEGIHIQWKAMVERIKNFADGQPIRFGDINTEWLERYRNYLITRKDKKGNTL
jgi:hypothetical protein